MIDRERRTLVTAMAGAGIFMGLVVFPRSGKGQISKARDTLAASNKQADELLAQIVRRETPLGEEFVKEMIEREFQIRSQTVATLAPLNRDDQIRVTRADRDHVTKLLIENELPIVPAREDIKKVEIKDIQVSEEPKEDEVFEVLLDIILDFFALLDAGEALKEVIRSNEELNSGLNRLTQSVIGRDWEVAAPTLIRIIGYFISSAFVAEISRVLREKYGPRAAGKIFRRFLVSLASKLTPFVGLIFVSLTLFLAIKKHAHRFG